MKLQTKLVLLVSVILLSSLCIAFIFLSSNANKTAQNEIGNRAKAISSMVAISPEIINAISNKEQHTCVQNFTEALQKETGVEFIVVIDKQGNRLSHPNVNLIGKHIVGGDENAALKGSSYTSLGEGTLGKSIRAFCPIYKDHSVIGAVVTGVSMDEVQQVILKRNIQFFLILIVVFACGVGLAIVVALHIKHTLLGMEPFAIARLTVERNTVIQSVREGVIVVDMEGKLSVVNEEAKRIFRQAGIIGELVGKNAAEVIPNTRMTDVVFSGNSEMDQEQKINDVYILTNRRPLIVEGKIIGSLATFRDLADVKKLAEELTGVKKYVEALRSQTHEFRNKLHIINGLILNEKYQELSKYIQQLSTMEDNEIKWIQKHVDDSIMSSFLQSKLSRSREMGVNLILDSNIIIPKMGDNDFRNGLVTVVGNLIDNAIDAVQFTKTKNVNVLVRQEVDKWFIQISDTGRGISTPDFSTIFQKGYSTKGENRGFGLFLVGKVVEKYSGTINFDSDNMYKTIFIVTLFPRKEV
jgi:two-component system, CitB family, sensor histidine kinase MalK